MNADLRIVLDTSVVVSALLLPRSVPRRAFDRAVASGRLLLSEATAFELDSVLRRPKFEPYVPQEKRLEFLAALIREAEIVEVKIPVVVCRDPEDDKFLALAVSGKASHIVTGDNDLLILHPFRGTAIMTPQAFIGEGKGDE